MSRAQGPKPTDGGPWSGPRPLVLDTHAVLWWVQGGDLLHPTATTAIAAASDLGISAISQWEIACLVRRGRVILDRPIDTGSEQVLALLRVRSLAITPTLALVADRLAMHADPANCKIVASARTDGAPLLTKDRAIAALPVV